MPTKHVGKLRKDGCGVNVRNLIVLAFVGLIAQLVDGALGMAYGVTSTTLLLTAGIAPAAASASVHLSEVGTTFVSGISHWRFGNVNWQTVRWMAIPGGIGAFLGAVVLSSISAEAAKPFIAVFLFGLGVYILIRFTSNKIGGPVVNRTISGKFLAPLGLGAGFLDAAGGGGWGPISTPTLLSSGRMEPRKVVGTVDTSEFLVALCASVGFLISLSFVEIPLRCYRCASYRRRLRCARSRLARQEAPRPRVGHRRRGGHPDHQRQDVSELLRHRRRDAHERLCPHHRRLARSPLLRHLRCPPGEDDR